MVAIMDSIAGHESGAFLLCHETSSNKAAFLVFDVDLSGKAMFRSEGDQVLTDSNFNTFTLVPRLISLLNVNVNSFTIVSPCTGWQLVRLMSTPSERCTNLFTPLPDRSVSWLRLSISNGWIRDVPLDIVVQSSPQVLVLVQVFADFGYCLPVTEPWGQQRPHSRNHVWHLLLP